MGFLLGRAQGGQLLNQLFFRFGEVLGQRQGQAQVEVAELAVFFVHRKALAAQAQARTIGRFGLELNFNLTTERFHGLLTAQQGFVDGHGHVLGQVVAGR